MHIVFFVFSIPQAILRALPGSTTQITPAHRSGGYAGGYVHGQNGHKSKDG